MEIIATLFVLFFTVETTFVKGVSRKRSDRLKRSDHSIHLGHAYRQSCQATNFHGHDQILIYKARDSAREHRGKSAAKSDIQPLGYKFGIKGTFKVDINFFLAIF